MTENIFTQFREDVSRELYNCTYEDLLPKNENEVDSEAYLRYEDWQQDELDRLGEDREDRDSLARAELDKRLGL